MKDNDYDTYKNPVEGKTYISPPIKDNFIESENIRIITRGIDKEESYDMVKKGEMLLRKTPGGKNIITAKILEDSRKIYVLKIQEYTAATGNPHKLGFSFIGNEITKLFSFLRDIQTMHFGSERYQRLNDADIEHIELTKNQAETFIEKNPELFNEVIRSKLTKSDIVAVAYRKKQLDCFEKMLNDTHFFTNLKTKYNLSTEAVWQKFFEKNHWIFGYGLGYIFLSSLDEKKLEQVVQGYSLSSHGKRMDAVMKTKGIISNLCFVEIKTHTTKLLEDNAYRSGCYAPSKELTGAIAQVQGSVVDASNSISNKLSIHDNTGDPTGESVYNYKAKAFLVIGSLEQFVTENGVNEDKLRSFELFRKNVVSPEIITFDELFERARFIVDFNDQ